MKKSIKITVAAILCICLTLLCASCGSKTETPPTTEPTTEATTAEPTTAPTTVPPTTVPPTTAPLTEKAPVEDEDYESDTPDPKVQALIDTLETRVFFFAGELNLNGGQKMNVTFVCDGTSSKLDMKSSNMNMSFIYFENEPYIASNKSGKYIKITSDVIDQFAASTQLLGQLGVSLNNKDVENMKSMLTNFDTTMDFSAYTKDATYLEYYTDVNSVKYLCSKFATDDGRMYLYTLDGAPKILDIYDKDGLRQMDFIISTFVPTAPQPVTLNGLTRASSITEIMS